MASSGPGPSQRRSERPPLQWGFVASSVSRSLSLLRARLVTNVFVGFAICFPCAYIVLLAATRNVATASIAIISVMGIVASVLGLCKWAMGWGLGIGESIAAVGSTISWQLCAGILIPSLWFAQVIVIGFSVDYVVHLSHVYVDAGHRNPPLNSRAERVTFALTSMGATVFSGAVTTFGTPRRHPFVPASGAFLPPMFSQTARPASSLD